MAGNEKYLFTMDYIVRLNFKLLLICFVCTQANSGSVYLYRNKRDKHTDDPSSLYIS
jgi:hypothetical protein